MADHLMPPKYLLEEAAVQIEEIAKATKEQNPFAAPAMHVANSIPENERNRIRGAILSTVDSDVKPAFAKFAAFVRREYAPQGRTEPGLWALPDGDNRYRFAVRTLTTTSKTPEEFHEIGLRQVSEIEREMLALAKSQGFGDLPSFNKSIRANKKFYAKSGEELVQLYRSYIDAMRPEMPKLFGHIPRAQLDVVVMESFRDKNAAPADYTPGSPDGKRPGRVNVNTYNPTKRLTGNIEAIAYHEGIPGHHQQLSLAQEQTNLPDFRKNGAYNAFVEGWALYSERLGKEIGFYKDPYSDYGRLQNEMWRAVRLVVDTGVHYKHWTRPQMIDYFHAHTAMDEPSIQSETDRYIAWPAQALGYKAGQIQILEMRDKAKQALGDKFDLRKFHDAVLEEGALPLDVFATQMTSWIDRNRSGHH
jgi:uncharacterized protein (DUF885 family)